jgi:hypothetical protein
MRISLHIGAHYTRTPRLVAAMNANERAFGRMNILSPGPDSYRPIITAALTRLDGLPPIVDEEDAILAEILGDNTAAQHLIMVNEKWAGGRNMMFQGGQLYTDIGPSVSRITELFSQHDLRISMAIRNPAALINSALASSGTPLSLKWFLKANDPMNLSWVTPINELQKAVPDVPITMWCEEDTPLIWPRIIRGIAGIPDDAPIRASLAGVIDALEPEGATRFRAFLRNHTLSTEQQYERAVLAFLDKYALESLAKPVYDVPDWNAQTVHDLSLNYEDDIAELSKREGVNFILPVTQDA